jgi:TetR/AcrR family transcriptional regulator of autoinduction and epiphytic fitness
VPVPTATLVENEEDGRNRRRSHSFDRAVDAVLDLIGEGIPSPTARQIADRSGISVRTVFRLTDDVEALHAAAVQRQAERIAPLFVPLPADGPLAERVQGLVESRASLFERIAPVRRVGERLAVNSPRIAAGIDQVHRQLRAQVASLFGSELDRLDASQRRDTLTALDAVSSWETWDHLRRLQGLSRRDTARTMGQLLEAVLWRAGGETAPTDHRN